MIDTGLPNVSIFESFLASVFRCLYFLKAFLSHPISATIIINLLTGALLHVYV